MGTGAITGYIDVAQIVLYIFWIFFFGLIVYLVQEGKREGFPLASDRRDYEVIQGWPPIPKPKTYRMADGSEFSAPHRRDLDAPPLAAKRFGNYPGSPIEPTGNPMLDGIGPGAWTARSDHPDHMLDGSVKIQPLRSATGYSVSVNDVNPIGLDVVGFDDMVGGKVVDLWVDQAEMLFRYLEVEVQGGKRVLVPMPFARVTKDAVKVHAILGSQFADAPTTKHADQVTLLEEDKIAGYYGGGRLYATPDRQEPLL
jgi:photosynthetic reaction center H subunit